MDVLTKAHNGKPLHGIEGRTPTEPVQGPKTLEEDAAARIQGQKPVRGRIQAGYKPQRAAKFKAYDEAYDLAISRGYDPGTASTLAKRELKGKLTKVGSRPMEGLGEPERQRMIARVHDVLKTSSPGRARAVEALNAAFKGTVPTRSEITLLEKVVPPAAVEKIVQDARGQRGMMDRFFDYLQIPRTMQSTADVSALFRQALPVITRHPKIWKDALGPSFKAMKSEKQFAAHYNALTAKESTAEFVDARAIQDVGSNFQGGARVEEAFGSATLEKAPLVGHSARQYGVPERPPRSDAGAVAAEDGEARGQAGGAPGARPRGGDREGAQGSRPLYQLDDGPGSSGELNTAAPLLNGLLFSPRLLSSGSICSRARSPTPVRRRTSAARRALDGPDGDRRHRGADSGLAHPRRGRGHEPALLRLRPDQDRRHPHRHLRRLPADRETDRPVLRRRGCLLGDRQEGAAQQGHVGGNTRLSLTMKFLREKALPERLFRHRLDGRPGRRRQQVRVVEAVAAGRADAGDGHRRHGEVQRPARSAGLVAGLGALGFSTMTYGDKKAKAKSDLPDLPDLPALPDLPDLPKAP